MPSVRASSRWSRSIGAIGGSLACGGARRRAPRGWGAPVGSEQAAGRPVGAGPDIARAGDGTEGL